MKLVSLHSQESAYSRDANLAPAYYSPSPRSSRFSTLTYTPHQQSHDTRWVMLNLSSTATRMQG